MRRGDIILESKSTGSEEQAHFVSLIVGKESFILVTSASQMSKAMDLFKKAGTNPIAAPAGYWTTPRQQLGPADLYPTSDGLGRAEKAVNGYLGIAWGTLRDGFISLRGAGKKSEG